jgi:hypothetical protein
MKKFSLVAQLNIEAVGLHATVKKITKALEGITAPVRLEIDARSATRIEALDKRLRSFNATLKDTVANSSNAGAAINRLGATFAAFATQTRGNAQSAARAIDEISGSIQQATELQFLERFTRSTGAYAIL